jgi:hypothetical protein
MRKIVALFLLFCPILSWAVNPALGGHNVTAVSGGTSGTITTTGVTTQASGSSFVVAAIALGTLTSFAVSSDTFSNSWGSPATAQETNDGGWLYVWVVNGGAGGASHTVTVTTGGGATLYKVDFFEVTNSVALDGAIGHGYSSASPNSTILVTPTQANDLIAGIAYSASGLNRPITAAGYTQIDQQFYASVDATSYASYYLLNPALSAQAPPMANGFSALAVVALAFKPASAAAPPSALFLVVP